MDGEIKALVQPAELILIGCDGMGMGALRSLAIRSPPSLRILNSVGGVLKGSPYNRAFYLSPLQMLNNLFVMARKQGRFKREEAWENPFPSQVLSKYAGFLPHHHALALVCDAPAWPSAAASRLSAATKIGQGCGLLAGAGKRGEQAQQRLLS